MASASRDLSIVVPCYNEEAVIETLVSRLRQAAARVTEDYEIVLVNDGSTDKTWPLIQQAIEADARIVGVDLARNHGHQLAISAGLSFCSGDFVLIIDADLQDPPELLPEMLALMKSESADVVYGQRIRRQGVSAWKKACYYAFYRALRFVSGSDIPVDTGDFRLVTRRVVDLVVSMPEQQRFLRGMIHWLGFRQVSYRYERDPRFAGEPKYTLRKLFRLAWDGIMSFSVFPLRLALLCGFALGMFGFITALYIIVAKAFLGQAPQGWSSLMVVILLIGSLQFFVLGIMGEYMGRIFLESKRRPLFLVREVARRDDASKPDGFIS